MPESTVHVRYNAQEAHLPVIITKGDGVALMGRDWLSTLKLNWKEISQEYQTNFPKPKLEYLVQQYPALFDGTLVLENKNASWAYSISYSLVIKFLKEKLVFGAVNINDI